jgi:hypothetical protein
MFFFSNNLLYDYYFYFIVIALIFYFLKTLKSGVLLSILITIIIYYYIDANIQEKHMQIKNDQEKSKDNVKNDVKDLKELGSSNFYVKEIPKKLKFLTQNKELMDIIYNIRFVKKFDKTKYVKCLSYMDKLMKVYIYILADRYDVNDYLPIFNDLKSDILEIFYSFIFVVPDNFKHIYGFEPYNEIEKSTEDLLKCINKMISILQNYAIIGKKKYYINNQKIKPYEKNKENYLP